MELQRDQVEVDFGYKSIVHTSKYFLLCRFLLLFPNASVSTAFERSMDY